MTIANPPIPVCESRTTLAQRQALANWHANLHSLSLAQPNLASTLQSIPPIPVEWVYARDGALSALDADRKWWTGCSVPRRAASAMLTTINQTATTGALLCPTHAAQIEYFLSQLTPAQALIAIQPDLNHIWISLHCADFSADIAAHRLWIAAGQDWPGELQRIFLHNPGLPAPQQMTRTILANDEQTTLIMHRVQRIITEEADRRAKQIAEIRTRAPRLASPPRQICIIAPSRFRLWADDGQTLAQTLAAAPSIHAKSLDTDDPAASAHLGLAMACEDCDALLAANISRDELSSTIPDALPLISWITSPRIPRFHPTSPRDILMLADPQWTPIARSAGWPDNRLLIAAWPARPAAAKPQTPPHLAIVADTVPIPPTHEFQLSSHELLWDMIYSELKSNPFAVGVDILRYLHDRMRRLSIQEQGVDQSRFIDGLIIPASQQAIARMLLAASLPLRLHGAGWNQIDEFAPHASGPIASPDDLAAAAGQSTALIHCWPASPAHPIESLSRPVLRAHTAARQLIDQARKSLTAPLPPANPHPLTPTLLTTLLRTL